MILRYAQKSLVWDDGMKISVYSMVEKDILIHYTRPRVPATYCKIRVITSVRLNIIC